MRSSPAPVSMLGRGRGSSVPSALPVVLHEHQVPDLDEALGAAEGRAALGPVGGALVEVDLRARTARAGVAHLPEVVVAHASGCARGGRRRASRQISSASSSLSCTVIHSRSPSMPEHLGDQLPGVGDGLLLEVVAEAEVAEHLEERAVPVGGADDVDVDGPEALLHRRGPRPRRRLVTHEEGLEGHHAGDGEEHGGVVRDEAGRRHRVCPRSAKKPVKAARSWSASGAVPAVTTKA